MKSVARIVFPTLMLIGFGFAGASTAKADPLLFSNVVALQNNGLTRVDLFSNPGTVLVGPQVSLLVDITGILPAGVTDTLRITYTELGSAPVVQTFIIPVFGTVQPPFTLLFNINSPGATEQGVLAFLTLDLLRSSPDFIIPGNDIPVNSYTYIFRVAQPVPEPATILLLGSGLVGVAQHLRKRRRISQGK
jgi:PEP-CTERM motif